jgi:hypothetical protein
MSDEVSVSKAPKFSEDDKDYFLWEMRFQAYAGVKKFMQAINPDGPDPALPADPKTPPVNGFTDPQKNAMERNSVAMYTLTLCLTSQGSMGFILKSRTKEYPGGLAWMVMKFMRERYAPKDRVSRVEMKRQLNAVKMGAKDNPAIMFEEFHRLANLFNDPSTGMEISQDDFMAQVFIAALDHYQSVLNSESRSIWRKFDSKPFGTGHDTVVEGHICQRYECGQGRRIQGDHAGGSSLEEEGPWWLQEV